MNDGQPVAAAQTPEDDPLQKDHKMAQSVSLTNLTNLCVSCTNAYIDACSLSNLIFFFFLYSKGRSGSSYSNSYSQGILQQGHGKVSSYARIY